MKNCLKPFLIGGALFAYVACSPKQFSKDPSYNACQNSGESCVVDNGRDYFSKTETVAGGKVDVLVVVDNSASMSAEQDQLGNRFSGFIQNLENQKIDYRVGIVTTDISSANNKPRGINNNGALQDGKLIAFSNGERFLNPSSGTVSQISNLFKSSIQRSETLACEQFILSELAKCRSQGISKESCIGRSAYIAAYDASCPSGDERGIFAARMVLENNPSKFLRKDADLAVIILSDEDVRSGLYRHAYTNKGETHLRNLNFDLTSKDSATSFILFMNEQFPQKSYNVHSITVPYYTDPGCRNTQAAQTGGVVGSSVGLQYENLAAAVSGQKKIPGVRGSICSASYAGHLQSIFDQVQGQIINKVSLNCSEPSDLNVEVTNAQGASLTMVTWTVVGEEVRFSSKLPVGSTVKVSYSCESL